MEDDFDPALELDLPNNGNSFGDYSFDDQRSPRSSNRSNSGHQQSNSLAWELAAAMEPSTNDSLLDELGIEDDEASSERAGTETGGDTSTSVTSPPSTPHRRGSTSLLDSHSEVDSVEMERDLSEAFASATNSLAESLSSTDLFLARLRAACDEAPLAETTSSSRSMPPLSTTIRLERLCATLVQTVTSIARHRESQVRELKELNKGFAVLSMAQLSEVEPLDASTSAATPAPLGSGLDVVREEDGDPLEEDPVTPITPRFANGPSLSRTGRNASQQQQLVGLRSSTISLLSTLSTINEATQVHRAAHADAERRLKSLRGVLATWRTDLEEVDKARAMIDEYEASRSRASETMGDLARREGKEVALRLDQAEARARELLSTTSL